MFNDTPGTGINYGPRGPRIIRTPRMHPQHNLQENDDLQCRKYPAAVYTSVPDCVINRDVKNNPNAAKIFIGHYDYSFPNLLAFLQFLADQYSEAKMLRGHVIISDLERYTHYNGSPKGCGHIYATFPEGTKDVSGFTQWMESRFLCDVNGVWMAKTEKGKEIIRFYIMTLEEKSEHVPNKSMVWEEPRVGARSSHGFFVTARRRPRNQPHQQQPMPYQQQQSANPYDQQQLASLYDQQQSANPYDQQQLASLHDQQQSANPYDQQQLASLYDQQQSANLYDQQQSANLYYQQQSANPYDQQQSGNSYDQQPPNYQPNFYYIPRTDALVILQQSAPYGL